MKKSRTKRTLPEAVEIDKPEGIRKERNKPNMDLMARAFINLYKEVGNVAITEK